MPTAVASSASAMAAHDVPHRGAHLVAAELAERRDDAEHGAEEADEGGVVPQRAEEQQPRLELLAPQPHRLGHDLLDRLGPIRVPVDGLGDDLRLDRLAPAEGLLHRRQVAAASPLRNRVGERSDVVPASPEEPPALEDDADREHRQPDQHVEHHARDERRDQHQLLHHHIRVHGLPFLLCVKAGA
jgi:hypothetical protein